MSQALVIFSSIVPSIFLVWYFDSRDLYPEPRRVLWTVFGLGILVALPVLPVAFFFTGVVESLESPLSRGLAAAFLQAAIPEELFKFVVVWFFAARHPAFDERMDGVVYGVVASLGFATLENVLYAWSGGLQMAALRAVTAVPSHAFLGAIMGFFVGQAVFSADRRRPLTLALVVPIALHGLYDFPLLAVKSAQATTGVPDATLIALTSLAPLIVAVEWIVAVRLTRRLRTGQSRAAGVPGRASSLLLTVSGAVVGAIGGVVLLGLTLGSLFELVEVTDAGELFAGGVLGGLTPTLIGAALFAWGIRRLNEADAAARGEMASPAEGEAQGRRDAATLKGGP